MYMVFHVSLLLCLRCPLHACCNATAMFVFGEELIAKLEWKVTYLTDQGFIWVQRHRIRNRIKDLEVLVTSLTEPKLKGFWTEALVWIRVLLFGLLDNNNLGCNLCHGS